MLTPLPPFFLQEACGPYGWGTTALVSSSVNLIPLDGLPPILTSTGVKGGKTGSNAFIRDKAGQLPGVHVLYLLLKSHDYSLVLLL